MDNLGFAYQKYKIIDKKEVAPDTVIFKFDGAIAFEPGQFVQAALDHFGEATFALCSSPHNSKFFELCIRNCGNTSAALSKLLPGDSVNLRGPYGNGWPMQKLKNKEIVLIAGGMGYIPLRPVIFELLRQRNFKKIWLFAGFRSDEHVILPTEFDEMNKNKKMAVNVVVEYKSKPSWYTKGLITEPLSKAKIDYKNAIALMCGPEIMYKFSNDVLLKKGLNEEQIFISFERRMECGIGVCQHCNVGKYLVCKDGPVFRLDQIKSEIGK